MSARELIDVLERETAVVLELVQALQEDQQFVVRHDIEALERSNASKEARVLHFQSLEQARRHVTEALGGELGLAPEEVRVSRICPLLAEGAELEQTASNLRAAVGSLGELVAVSRGFLEQSILGIRGLLALIQTLRSPDPGTYDANGRYAPASEAVAVAVRREV